MSNSDIKNVTLKVKWRGGFADRNNFSPISVEIQKESLDNRFRTQLYNLFIDYMNTKRNSSTNRGFRNEKIINLFFREFYLTDIRYNASAGNCYNIYDLFIRTIEDTIYNDHWYNVCSFIEFWNKIDLDIKGENTKFKSSINEILKKEFVGYRLIDSSVVAITDNIEIEEIESMAEIPYKEVKEHIRNALDKLSDRENPDYKNSIKESISSVEALSKILAEMPSTTLNKALTALNKKGVNIHPSLRQAFEKLYAYTSDESGIRHSNKIGGVASTYEEAKFMIVACSAFNNYLISNNSKEN